MKLAVAAAVLSALAPFAFSQSNAGVAGHWEGAIDVPGQPLKIQVDLAQDHKDQWKGTVSIPDQNLKGFPLSSVSVAGAAVKFAIQGIPGGPAFDGKLAAGGQTIAGSFTQSGATRSFSLKRTGEAQFDRSAAVAKEIEGSWEGTLDTPNGQLRLVLKLANEDGGATGTLTSVDQGGAVIPIASISQNGADFKFEVPSIGGSYAGQVGKRSSTITGNWTQGMGTLPLTFHRPAAGK